LDAVERKLVAQFPGVAVTRYSKPGPSRPCSLELRQRILADGNGCLVAALAD
jgi:hypothetical protein